MFKALIDGNRKFREEIFHPHKLDRFTAGQNPDVMWIGCSDSRVPAEHITGHGCGELFVVENVANLIPVNNPAVGSALDYAVLHLNVKHIVICGHTLCGGIAALWKGVPKGTLIGDWMDNASEALRRVRKRQKSEKFPDDVALKLLVEENVRVQLEHTLRYPFVRKAVNSGRLKLHPVIYDLATGKLKKVK